MKKMVLIWIVVLLFGLTGIQTAAFELPPIISYEYEGQDNAAQAFDFQAQLQAAGAEELLEELPPQSQEILQGMGIDRIDFAQILQLTPAQFFEQLWHLLLAQAQKPLKVFSGVLGVVLLCALLDALKTALWEGTLAAVFSGVSVACVAAAIASPLVSCIHRTAQAIEECAAFIVSFIPVFSSIVMAGGQPVTATTYTAFLFMACQVVSQIAAQILVPLMGIYLAFCMVGSLAPNIHMETVSKTIKSVVSWTLGLLLTLFVGLLSLQTMVASGSDSVMNKTAKFLIGSFVPVVGGALSDAFSATQGYMKLLRTTVGVFGILAALVSFLPVMLQAVLWHLTVSITAAVSDLLGVTQVGRLLKSASAALGVLIAGICCFAMLVIIATSLVLMTSMGV